MYTERQKIMPQIPEYLNALGFCSFLDDMRSVKNILN